MSDSLTARALFIPGKATRKLILQHNLSFSYGKITNAQIRRALCLNEKESSCVRPIFVTELVEDLYTELGHIATDVIAKDGLESQQREFADGVHSGLIARLAEKYGKQIYSTSLEDRGGPRSDLVIADAEEGEIDLDWKLPQHRAFIALHLEHLAFHRARSHCNNHSRSQPSASGPGGKSTQKYPVNAQAQAKPVKTTKIVVLKYAKHPYDSMLARKLFAGKRKRDDSGRFLPLNYSEDSEDEDAYESDEEESYEEESFEDESDRDEVDEDETHDDESDENEFEHEPKKRRTFMHMRAAQRVENVDRNVNIAADIASVSDGDVPMEDDNGFLDNNGRVGEGSLTPPSADHVDIANTIEDNIWNRTGSGSSAGAANRPESFSVSNPYHLDESENDAKPVIDLTGDDVEASANKAYTPQNIGCVRQPSQHSNSQTLSKSEIENLRKILERVLFGELCADDEESATDLTNTTALLAQSRKIDDTLLRLWQADEARIRPALGNNYERTNSIVRQWLCWREGVWTYNEAIGVHLIQPIEVPNLSHEDWIERLGGMKEYRSLYLKLLRHDSQRDECIVQKPENRKEVDVVLAWVFGALLNKAGPQAIFQMSIPGFNDKLFGSSILLT